MDGTVKENTKCVIEVENMESNNRNKNGPLLKMEIDIKQEVSDDNQITSVNMYDSSLVVCKEEYDNLGGLSCDEVSDRLHPVTDSKELCTTQYNPLLTCVKSEPMDNEMDPLTHTYVEISVDCKPTTGGWTVPPCTHIGESSAQISAKANNIQGNIAPTELEDSKEHITKLTLNETHLDNINTNIYNADDNFEAKAELRNQLDSYEMRTAAILQSKVCYRDLYNKNIQYENDNNSTTTDAIRPLSIKCHLKKNTGKKNFSCQICDYKCGRKSNLESHMRTHTGEKPYSCTHCDYKCSHKSSLFNHIRTHTGDKPFSCQLCDYKCGRKNSLVVHMRTHTGEKPFSCNHCNYKCCRKSDLVNHMRTHTGDKPYSCHVCDYKCNGREHLARHVRTHTGEKPFLCSLCNVKYGRKEHLARHMKTHTGENLFSCHICEYKCTGREHLGRHMRTHTGEKPFLCGLCNVAYGRKEHLVRHMRTHTGEKPFSCNDCDYKCNGREQLARHVRTHTGEKPFLCSVCYVRYSRKEHLVRHMKTHTGEEIFIM